MNLMMKWFLLFFVFVYWSKAEESGDGTVDLYFMCVARFDEDPDLPPILLLHGLMGDTSNWYGIHEELAKETKRKVCMADARNHGKSPKTEEFTFDLMAADTVRLMDRLNMDKAVLLGHSMGGKTASVTALKYPNRVEKVILEDMRPNTIAPEALTIAKSMTEMLQKSLDAVPEGATDQEARDAVVNFIKNTMKTLGQKMGNDTENHVNSLLICENGKCQFSVDLDFIKKAQNDPELFHKIYDGRFEGEALFIYGAISPFKVGEAEEEIRHLFPRAQMVPIEGASHGVHLQKRREFLSAVIKFINAGDYES